MKFDYDVEVKGQRRKAESFPSLRVENPLPFGMGSSRNNRIMKRNFGG